MRASGALRSLSAAQSCAADKAPGKNSKPAGSGRYVVYVQDKPFGALSEVAFGLNIVVDDDRLPPRRTINGNSQWTTWNLDVPMANIKSASSIIGPVVDRSRRALLYLRPKNMMGSQDVPRVATRVILAVNCS